MTTGNENSINSKDKEIRTIGAFCTDIEDSVDRIDNHGDKAFKHHAAYIEKVAEAYGKQLKIHKVKKSSQKPPVERSNFWIPGDALWGVVFEEAGQSTHNSMIISFARVLNACAYGLVKAHNKALELKIEHLRIRGAMIGGQVLVKELKELNSTLYSGSSLNACGRLQNETASNSVILGFVFPGNKPGTDLPVDLNIGSPEIQVNEISECLNKLILGYRKLSLCKPGCKLIFETVQSNDGKKFIRFSSLPQEIRGLKRCSVITSRVKLEIDENQDGIRLCDNIAGSWGRSTVKLENNPGAVHLMELVKRASNCDFTLPGVYKRDNVVIQVPKTAGEDFILHYNGDRYRPRAGIEREPAKKVDFKKYGFCCLPIFSASNRDTVLLIKGIINRNKKSLVLHEIDDQLNKKYDDLSSFIDSAGGCAEFIFD